MILSIVAVTKLSVSKVQFRSKSIHPYSKSKQFLSRFKPSSYYYYDVKTCCGRDLQSHNFVTATIAAAPRTGLACKAYKEGRVK